MKPVLTITIDSGDYVDANNLLRVKQTDFSFPRVADEKTVAILKVRRLLGFSMHPADMYSDYVENLNLEPVAV